MRIISGSFKGKKILEPKDKKTRPLKDLTKESIFNIILHSNKFEIKLANSNILDLFSGIGSFGIECLSRGVKKVTFVENYPGVLPILKQNLNTLTSVKNFEVIEENIYNNDIISNFNTKFDIIFLDPPYKDKNLENLLFKIREICKKHSIVIIHRHKNEIDILPPAFRLIDQKIYGISKIIFLSLN